MEARNRPSQTTPRPSIRSRVWRSFHAWTLAAIGVLTAANVLSALRPFQSSHDLQGAVQPLIRIAGQDKAQSASQTREPAASAGALIAGSGDDHMVEVRIDCQQRLEIQLTSKVQSLRLQLSDCTQNSSPQAKGVKAKAPASVAMPSYYVRNETNGFEGTVFRIPAAQDRISTDFITLENGKNLIRISRSLENQPSVEQWLTVTRQ